MTSHPLIYFHVAGILFVVAYGGLIVLMGSYAPAQVISAMQSSSLAAIIASKVIVWKVQSDIDALSAQVVKMCNEDWLTGLAVSRFFRQELTIRTATRVSCHLRLYC